MKNKKKIYEAISGIIFFITTWSQLFFINYLFPLGFMAIVFALINITILNRRLTGKLYNILVGATFLFIFFEVLWMFFDNIVLFVIAQLTSAIIGLILLCIGLAILDKSKNNFKRISIRVLKGIFILILLSITAVLLIFVITPKPVTLYLQNQSGAQNTYKVARSETKVINNKYKLITNIQYGEKYPRSYLNIITPNGKIDNNRPTYFYVHGGGFIMGDAMQGDPNAESKNNATLYHYEKMIDNGYNVVTINYALAPQYKHPTPVKQLSEAVEFMKKDSKKFGINMNNVVFAGGSSGGHIVTEFATIQASPKFSKQIGISPVISLDNIKALVLESPALDATRAHKTETESVIADYIFGQSLAAYINQPLISGDKKKIEFLNLIPKATKNFPPTFISDGNTATFSDQARDYYNRLKELGVKTELYIPNISNGKEGHGFMVLDVHSKAAQTYITKKIDFLSSLD